MNDSLLRQILILNYLPFYPAKTTTRALLNKLSEHAIQTTIRTVQRDLESLCHLGIFAISADKVSKPAGWYWMKESRQLQIPYMDINTAVALNVISEQATLLLPKSIRQQLEPLFAQANLILQGRESWASKTSINSYSLEMHQNASQKTRDLIYKALNENMLLSMDVADSVTGMSTHHNLISPIKVTLRDTKTFLTFESARDSKVMTAGLEHIDNVVISGNTRMKHA